MRSSSPWSLTVRLPSLIAALLLAALWGPACATSPPARAAQAEAPSGERAFMWMVQGDKEGGGRAFLVGSVHLAQAGELKVPPSMEKAFFISEALVVEVDVGEVSSAEVRDFIAEHGMLPEGQRLSEVLEPETAKLLAATAERTGVSLEGLEQMRPWLVALMLPSLFPQEARYMPQLGIDMLFLQQARGIKPIIELETAEEQMRVFSELPAPVQDRMLRDHLVHMEERAGELERLTAAWNAGDAEALAATVFQREEKDPALSPMYEKLFYERNLRMAEKIEGLLAEKAVWFVVVGAGHVVGPRGLVELLRKQGYQVRQLSKQ